ncbi:MAG: hypothetical protein JW874_00920 [Spirochaetales bacterium]|nr:hypothetical protein [Spirochaetales bacterium]
MAIKEGKWKCQYCGAINPGRNTACADCKSVRGDDVKFFLDDDAGEVQDQDLLNMANAGADWSCDYCQTDNRSTDTVCRQCGAARSDGGITRKQSVRLDRDNQGPPPPVKPKKKSRMLPVILGIAAVAVIAVVLVFVLGTKELELTVQQGSWERVIGVESRRWVTREDWTAKVPDNARIISSETRQSGTRKVQTGTEKVKTGTKDMGNGFFEDVYEDRPVYREDPVYDTWVKYDVIEWVEQRQVRQKGGMNDPPVWPEPQFKLYEREGKRTESAELQLFDPQKNKTYIYKCAPAELSRYAQNKPYKATVTVTGAVKSLE